MEPIRSRQLRVLRLGFFQNGDVGVSIFPKSEEVQRLVAKQKARVKDS